MVYINHTENRWGNSRQISISKMRSLPSIILVLILNLKLETSVGRNSGVDKLIRRRSSQAMTLIVSLRIKQNVTNVGKLGIFLKTAVQTHRRCSWRLYSCFQPIPRT